MIVIFADQIGTIRRHNGTDRGGEDPEQHTR